MESDRIKQALDGLVETLANIEHERWSRWQTYMHSKGVRQPDGSMIIPAELVTRWEAQIATPYGQLTDKEQESDREQVREYLRIIAEAMAKL